MIKFIVGFVAVVFVAVVGYMYMQHTDAVPQQAAPATHQAEVTKPHETQESTVAQPETKTATPKKEPAAKKVVASMTGAKGYRLDQKTLNKIEEEVNGNLESVRLSKTTLHKIESEIRGESKIDLDDEILRKIEAEVNGNGKLKLDEEMVKTIESELNGDSKIKLNDETLRKIESEVRAYHGQNNM